MPGRVTLAVIAGGRVGYGHALVRSGSPLPLDVASHSLPTVHALPPMLRMRTTSVVPLAVVDIRTVAGGALSSRASREVVGSTRTTVRVVIAPSIQCAPSYAGSNDSLATFTPRPAP